jgi:hypothetical protein
MVNWKYDQGIVSTKNHPFTSFKQRLYHVRYRNQDNDLCRLISASFVYGIPKQTSEETEVTEDDKQKDEKFLLWLKQNNEEEDSDEDDTETINNITNVFSTAILTMSKVITIMDFRLSEKNDIPTNVITKETDYELLIPDGTDKENFLHLAHFEHYLPKCGVESCICTLTNDEEAARRIKEITCVQNTPS